jgi:hypothetical protein
VDKFVVEVNAGKVLHFFVEEAVILQKGKRRRWWLRQSLKKIIAWGELGRLGVLEKYNKYIKSRVMGVYYKSSIKEAVKNGQVVGMRTYLVNSEELMVIDGSAYKVCKSIEKIDVRI